MKAVLINKDNIVENIIMWDDTCTEVPGYKYIIVEDNAEVGIGWTCNPVTKAFITNVDPNAWKDGLSNIELRRFAYPPMADYLDAVYWQSQGDSSKMTAYLSAIEAIKLQYPKE
jgi:hypothetical protein